MALVNNHSRVYDVTRLRWHYTVAQFPTRTAVE